jgi:hypothetical protein
MRASYYAIAAASPLVMSCAAHETRAIPPSRPAEAGGITVTYREAANVFEIMDNVSMWLSGKAARRGGGRRQRAAGLALRPRKPVDRLAEAFYDSATVDEALVKLADVATPEDIAELRAFYAVYRPQYESMLTERPRVSSICQSRPLFERS